MNLAVFQANNNVKKRHETILSVKNNRKITYNFVLNIANKLL